MTCSFDLPPAVAALVRQGMELGHANDHVFSLHNSKQSGGAVGSLTGEKEREREREREEEERGGERKM